MKNMITAILLVVFMNNFDITALNLGVPTFIHTLHFTYSQIHLFSALYLVVCGILFIPSGYIGDQIGHHKIFFTGTLLFLFSSCIMAMSHQADMFLVGRGIQGMGMSMTLASVMPIIHSTYHSHALKKITLVTLTIALSQAIGPILGAFIIHAISWRSLFIINIPISLLALWISYSTIRVKKPLPSMKANPMLNSMLMLFKSHQYSITVIIRGLFQFVYFGMLFILPVYFLMVLNHTILHTSYYMLSITLGFSIVSLLQISDILTTNQKQYLWIGFLCQILGCSLYCLFGLHPNPMLLLCAGFIFGCGAACILPLTFSYALQFAPNNQKGIASGIMLCIAFLAGGFGAYLSSHLSLSSASIHIKSITPFIHVCLLYLLLLFLCMVLSFTINTKGRQNA